jgi:hypothetical protein
VTNRVTGFQHDGPPSVASTCASTRLRAGPMAGGTFRRDLPPPPPPPPPPLPAALPPPLPALRDAPCPSITLVTEPDGSMRQQVVVRLSRRLSSSPSVTPSSESLPLERGSSSSGRWMSSCDDMRRCDEKSSFVEIEFPDPPLRLARTTWASKR